MRPTLSFDEKCHVQRQSCFLCGGLMQTCQRSREHLYPKYLVGYLCERYQLNKYLVVAIRQSNVVAAHKVCNNVKAGRLPTDAELLKFEHVYGYAHPMQNVVKERFPGLKDPVSVHDLPLSEKRYYDR